LRIETLRWGRLGYFGMERSESSEHMNNILLNKKIIEITFMLLKVYKITDIIENLFVIVRGEM